MTLGWLFRFVSFPFRKRGILDPQHKEKKFGKQDLLEIFGLARLLPEGGILSRRFRLIRLIHKG
jgi:hypothetical protein